MARVFLSHSSRDNASAARMKAWLEQQGFDAPFLDFDKDSGIQPGANWEQTLYREIEQSQAVLILLSANWAASKWCDREFIQARGLGKPIFPVIDSADGDPKQNPAPDLQWLDLRQQREAGLEQLMKQLAEIALTAQGGIPWDGSRPPYPGLLAFEEEDAPIYFGREDDIRHLIERLRARRTLGGSRLLALLGASGSGKSSLLRAGVLPRLRRAGRGWLVVPPFRPQSQPCQELARALALATGQAADWRALHASLLEGARAGTLPAVLATIASDLRMAVKRNEAQILLSIDQGEELFGGLEPEELHSFFRILTAAMDGDLPFLAVMTLRSEFLGRLQAAEKDGLTARFEEVSLAPLPMAQIPAIIKRPAQVAGVEVEEAFVQRAAADAETEDALPLLAFALREIYERYGGDRLLSLSDYQALGDAKDDLSPLENAVRRRADEVLTGMHPSDEQMKALRDAFVPAMVDVEQGNYVRRTARWDALPSEAQPLLQQLVNARLLISREEEGHRLLEVAHEALLRKWPLLRGWLDEDREFLIGSKQLDQDLQDWQKAGEQERPAALLSGLKLQRAKAWLAERPQQLSDEQRVFVQASSDQVEAQERKKRRNRRRVLAGLSGLTALAVAGGGIALWQLGQTRRAFEARASELIRVSWRDLGKNLEQQERLNAVAAILNLHRESGDSDLSDFDVGRYKLKGDWRRFFPAAFPSIDWKLPDAKELNEARSILLEDLAPSISGAATNNEELSESNCWTWLDQGFRGLYCSIRNVVDFEKLQTISGLNIFRAGGPHEKRLNLNDESQFGHYNPQFLDWLDKNMIPQGLDNPEFNSLANLVYKHSLGPLVRALYNSHVILFASPEDYRTFEKDFDRAKDVHESRSSNRDPNYKWRGDMMFSGPPKSLDAIKTDYQQAIKQGNLSKWEGGLKDGREYDLAEDFRWLADYLRVAKNDNWYLANNAGGFWARRSIDGTEAKIFELITKLLKKFEPEVLSKSAKSIAYPEGVICTVDGVVQQQRPTDGPATCKAKGRDYKGQFVANEFRGTGGLSDEGLWIHANGSFCIAPMLRGKLNGKGTCWLENNATYQGGFVEDKFQGQGVAKWGDGSKFEGGFKADKWHGKGKYTPKPGSGASISGYWKEGVRTQ